MKGCCRYAKGPPRRLHLQQDMSANTQTEPSRVIGGIQHTAMGFPCVLISNGKDMHIVIGPEDLLKLQSKKRTRLAGQLSILQCLQHRLRQDGLIEGYLGTAEDGCQL